MAGAKALKSGAIKRAARPKPRSDQFASFKETAREHECDESEAAFDKALKKIGKIEPTDRKGN